MEKKYTKVKIIIEIIKAFSIIGIVVSENWGNGIFWFLALIGSIILKEQFNELDFA